MFCCSKKMTLARLLGILDLLAAFAILLADGIPYGISKTLALYLILKGGVFALMGDKISILDILCGLYLLAASNGISWTLASIVAALFLVQKAVLSLI